MFDHKNISKRTSHISMRKFILNKSRELFGVQGYQNTTMNKIARACNFEKSNLYYYFPNKESILYEIYLYDINYMISKHKRHEKDFENDPVRCLQLFISNQIRLSLRWKKTTDMMSDFELRNLSREKRKEIINLRDILETMLCNIITKGIEAGIFKKVDVKIVAFSIFSMIIRTRVWYSPRGRLSKDKIASIISSFVLDGLLKDRSVDVKTLTR